jgi:chemotaxis protein MotB
MKTLLKILLISTSALIISSCVSSSKFAKIQDENNKNKDQVASLDAKNNELTKTIDQLQGQLATTKAQLDLKEKNLNENMSMLGKDQEALTQLQKAIQLEKTEIGSIRQEVCNALKCFTPDELTIEVRDGELYVQMYDKLLFPTGESKVNKRGKEALKMISAVLKNNNNIQTMVEGHTDAIPINNSRYKDNWDLSVSRATSVTRLLIKDGVKPDNIIASGRSKFHPFDSNESEKGRSLNRRTDIVLVPKLDQLYSLIEQGNNFDQKHN